MESNLKTLLDQPLLAREELARKLGVSVDTIGGWTSEKRIPSFRLGHRLVRYSYPAVVASLAKYYRPPEQDWTRNLPKRRKCLPVQPTKAYQTEMVLEGQQLLFPFVSQLFGQGLSKAFNF